RREPLRVALAAPLRGDGLTRSELRDQVLGFVLDYPGVHAREVERRLGLSERLASYHLLALEQEGLLRRLDQGGYARFYPQEAARRLTRKDFDFIGLMRRPPSLQITVL